MDDVHMAVSRPLIAKLEAWGYQDAPAASLVSILGRLDKPSLNLVERLVNDLTNLNDDAYNLRAEVTRLEEKLNQEKLNLERLRVENQKLLEKTSCLSKELDNLQKSSSDTGRKDDVEEQVQQWRAQSMHQLQELENMNQALRATLNLQSCSPSSGSKEDGDDVTELPPSKLPCITMSGEVGKPRQTSPFKSKPNLNASKANVVDLVSVADMRCKRLEDELHSLKDRYEILEVKLEAAQKQIGSVALSNGNKNCPGDTKETSNADVSICTDHFQAEADIGEAEQDSIHTVTSKFGDLTADLLSMLQVYEMELQALASENLSDAEALTSQSTVRKKSLDNGFYNHQEHSENGLKDFFKDLEYKSKIQGIAALCMDGDKYPALSENPRIDAKQSVQLILKMKAAKEELELRFSQYEKNLSQMIRAVQKFKAQSMGKVEVLKGKIHEVQSILESQESMIASLRLEISKKNDQLSFIMDEKVVGEEALQASQSECNELASFIRDIDGNMGQLTTVLATRTKERDQEAKARRNSEQVQRNCENMMIELDGARKQVSNLQTELAQTKEHQEGDKCRAGGLNSELQECITRMETAERDVEQLKGLIIQLDGTREELASKLMGAIQSEKRAEKRFEALDFEVRRMTEEAGSRHLEVERLCGLLEVFGRERDHLQSETNLQAERIARLTDDSTTLESEVRFLKSNLQATEQRLQTANSLLSQAEAELMSVKEQYSMEAATKNRLEELWTVKCSEHRAVAEELGSLTCEHQILKNDLVQLTSSHEGLMDNLRNISTRLSHTEQVLCAKEKGQEELLAMYRKICEENQYLKQSSFELENQVQCQQHQLEEAQGNCHKLQEQARSFEQEIQHRSSEVKAMERQADLMTRSLNQQSGLLNDYQNEKAALMTQLSAAKMALTDLDAKLDNAMREITTLQGKNQHLSDQIHEAKKEAERLTTSWKVEQHRVMELEHLLACLRAEEQQLEMASKGTVEQNFMMKEHISALEEQVMILKQTRDSQNQEIMRLQTSRTRSDGDEGRRFWSPGTCASYSIQPLATQPRQIANDVACSKAKILELEMKLMSMTTDLSKTTVLYKDCFSKLQNAETQSLELKKEFDHVLDLLSKVDEERTRLRHQCAELERALLKHQQHSGQCGPPKSPHPEIEKMQQECHRLKNEAASRETDGSVVAKVA